MSRYIDADKLRDDWIDEMNEPIYAANDVLDSIDEQPTADVVEVVRCKDCEHRDKNCCKDGDIHCEIVRGYMAQDDYCIYGERREEENEVHSMRQGVRADQRSSKDVLGRVSGAAEKR